MVINIEISPKKKKREKKDPGFAYEQVDLFLSS